ncbi:putative sporulation protein YtxC [Alkalithermobacter thermoalcaliphilus JW-YL-7 = DSM 7308]|uniref:Sporulation protein YtxC n=1 Tax=Alkalithermobacter thermoalcaliphilus JW-YL-7 = DSM 7308 TaxID=1121328 RepID=A0A150FP00_CLOPD|nr:Sporulation protein YtxC [[Clostridium] paradoxum JW-YL-7 = DSM 7308]SHK83557.1 putative sporulation protein YtxC [[Clostridium] paradoxum JW-YL-7 = DSM 7308]
MEYISLGVIGDYKDFNIENINYYGLEKRVFKNDDFIQVDIMVEDGKKDICKKAVAHQLTDMIMGTIKNKLLRKVVEQSYKDIYLDEINNIYNYCLQIFSEKEEIIKKIVFDRIQDYLSANDYMNINGFLRFRLRDFIDYMIEISDKGLEKYLIDKDYKEFIQLLRYFVQIQDEKEEVLKIYIEEHGNFKLCDKYDRPFKSIYVDDIMQLALRENMNYEDFLISTLITICPREILIYDKLNNNFSREITELIQAIFDEKVKINYEH